MVALKLFIYEHCPYCIRPRLVADIKKINLDLEVLANDDEQTPIAMIGQKMVPVLQRLNGQFMLESLDICQYLDHIDGHPILLPAALPAVAMNLLADIEKLARKLTHPRQIFHADNHVDFPTDAAKKYFRLKKEASLGETFEEALEKSGYYAMALQPKLDAFSEYVGADYVQRQPSWDDVLVFPVLRSLMIAADVLSLPAAVQRYIDFICQQTRIRAYH